MTLNKTKSLKLLFFPLISIVLLTVFLTFHVQNIFPSFVNQREILSSLAFFSQTTQEQYQVLKVKNRDRIWVEIYQNLGNAQYKFISQIDPKNKYDGYFLLGGNATNMAFMDVDNDRQHEIIVPGFDQNLQAYLNVIKFDVSSKTFTLLSDLNTNSL